MLILSTDEIAGSGIVEQRRGRVQFVDLFAGAGGSGSGIVNAVDRMQLDYDGTFANHWLEGIATHARNHPKHVHLKADLFKLAPEQVFPPGTDCTLLWGSPACFPAHIRVTTARGLVPISEVKTGDLVLTHKGRWRKVVAQASRDADTIVLKGHGHSGLETTAEHPFFSKRVTTRYPGKGSDGRRVGNVRRAENPYWPEAKDMAGKLWAIPTYAEPLPIPMDHGMLLDEGFFYMLGRWLGDGSYSKGDLVITCAACELDNLQQRLKAVRTGSGDATVWRPDRDTGLSARRLSLGCADLVRFVQREFGRLAHGKNLPGWVFGMPKVWRTALVSGYLDADGHDYPERRSSFTTVSDALCHGFKMLLADTAATTHIRQMENAGEIDGRKISGGPCNTVTWKPDSARKTSFPEALHRFQFCKKVLPGRRKVRVYNIQVEEDESYVVDGIAVHNCTFFSIARGAATINEQDRSHAYCMVRWVEHLRPEIVMVENVREFRDWGPVVQKRDADGELVWARKGRPTEPSRGRPEWLDERAWARAMLRAGYERYMVPCQERKRLYFDAWVAELRQLGYHVEWRIICSADMGGATIRRRLFLQAVRRDCGKRIVWPAAAHAKNGDAPLGKWRGADTAVIDWSLKGESMFTRKRPLVKATMRRAAIGLVRFSLADFFIPQNRGFGEGTRSAAAPVSSLTTNHRGEMICSSSAVLLPSNKGFVDANTRAAEDPLTTLTTKSRAEGLVCMEATPFVLPKDQGLDKRNTRSVADPTSTIQTKAADFLCRPTIIPLYGESKVRDVSDPIDSQGTCAHDYLLDPQIVHLRGTGGTTEASAPCHSLTANGTHEMLADALLMAIDQTGGGKNHGVYPSDGPVRTLVTKANTSVVEFSLHTLEDCIRKQALPAGVDASRVIDLLEPLMEELRKHGRVDLKPYIYVYYGSGSPGSPVTEPLPTIRTKSAQAVCYPALEFNGQMFKLDILYRMLEAHELQRAMGFPDDYDWGDMTKTEIIKAIGNSVSREVAEALTLSWLAQREDWYNI